jgi:predicted TIM-barrel fold metal-dependent hydrolase
VRIARDGHFNDELLRVFVRNSRFPAMVQGDTRASIAAVRIGERRLIELFERFGRELNYWFAEGFFLVRDPDVAHALARAYNAWIADFCTAAPERLLAAAILPLQNMDFALEELQRVARIPSVRAVFIRPMFLEDRYLNHPYYDPLWAELERLGITAAVHATAGLWNPEWTSHGPFFEKIKDRLVQPIAPGGGGGPFAGGSGGAGQTTTFTGATPLGHPLAPILANWLDNHMFVASTLIGFTVMERFPAMKVVVAHGKASWMQEGARKDSSQMDPRYITAMRPASCATTARSCEMNR